MPAMTRNRTSGALRDPNASMPPSSSKTRPTPVPTSHSQFDASVSSSVLIRVGVGRRGACQAGGLQAGEQDAGALEQRDAGQQRERRCSGQRDALCWGCEGHAGHGETSGVVWGVQGSDGRSWGYRAPGASGRSPGVKDAVPGATRRDARGRAAAGIAERPATGDGALVDVGEAAAGAGTVARCARRTARRARRRAGRAPALR